MENTPRVFIYIHSNGGDAFAGLSGMDHIRFNRVPVTTIVDGMVASAASFLLLGASVRKCMPNSFVRIHQVSIMGFDGKFDEFQDEYQNSNSLMDTVRNVYLSNTSMSRKRLEEILKKEIDMNAHTCVREGIVQSIIQETSSHGV
jgi:ATP-dependent Clp protease protease subunit